MLVLRSRDCGSHLIARACLHVSKQRKATRSRCRFNGITGLAVAEKLSTLVNILVQHEGENGKMCGCVAHSSTVVLVMQEGQCKKQVQYVSACTVQ